MRFTLKETRLGLRNSTTRLPFRYGVACLTWCPQAVLRATIEVNGRCFRGYAGDGLPPGWFDKSPGKTFEDQIKAMIQAIAVAEKTFLAEATRPVTFFPAWNAVQDRTHRSGREDGVENLLVSFGVSMVERAVMDAMARAAKSTFADAVRQNLYAVEPGEIHPELAGLEPRDWLPPAPAEQVFVRHTVGLSDPVTIDDIPDEDALDDGYPHALEQYIRSDGICYFKIKVANDLDSDLPRLVKIARVIERHLGDRYQITLDGNEQYKSADEFDRLTHAIRHDDALATLWSNTLLIEQPLERHIALSDEHTHRIRELANDKPVIIDESDGDVHAYRRAIDLGYRGVSSKNCKGPVKSLLNAGLTWFHNDHGTRPTYYMTGEDLCCVGVVPVQADLCLVATLGLAHSERNGHHYHQGISYLPEDQQRAALAAHGDFYRQHHDRIAPWVRNGRFHIGSLQCPGFGFESEPDLDSMSNPEQWQPVETS